MIIKSQFFWRTYLGYMAVVVLSTTIFASWIAGAIVRDSVDEIETHLRNGAMVAAQSASRPLQTLNYPELTAFTANFGEVTGYRLTIVDTNGLVAADSSANPFNMSNHLQRPEMIDALTRDVGRAVRFSQTMQEEYLFYAVPVVSGQQLLGFARTGMPTRELRSIRMEHLSLIMKGASAILFCGLLLAFYLAARQSAPLDTITRVAEVIAEGDFDKRLPVDNVLGLKKLASVINQIARNSAERVAVITSDRNRLSAIFDGMVEGVIDVDQNQRIQHINGTAARLLGLSEKNCLGKPIWQEVRSREVNRAVEEAMGSRTVVKTQMRLSRKTDELVVDIHAASLSDHAGKPIGAVVVLNDITDLKHLERVRTDFVANASHELKTPITAIRGLSETIIGDPEADRDTMMSFMERIHAQSLRLSHLVGDLMTISRLESSESEGEHSLVSVNDLVKRSVQSAESASEAKQQKLLLELPEERVQVMGDNQSLSQLVDNLIDNAIKYTPEKGRIRVSLMTADGHLSLSVEDSGIGISPQYQERVFERFYRVDKARSQSLGGTGLGLSIVKNIAERHGGEVTLQSQPGAGSTFTFSMPLA